MGITLLFPNISGLIAAGRYTDAYMINWESNVFPGFLEGHVIDLVSPRAVRVEDEPVAICRLEKE